MDNKPLEIKLTNKITGEITEFSVTGGDDATNKYYELMVAYKAHEKALSQLKNYIDEFMGEDDELRLGDGHVVKRTQRETRSWTAAGLREVGFDDDAILMMSKVNMTMAKEIVKESIERGDIKPDAKKELEAAADVAVSKPFLIFK